MKKYILRYMASILYYSNYCNFCKKLLNYFSKTKLSEKIHFINIDNRHTKQNKTHITLSNGQKLSLPPHINKVPALMLMNSYNVIYGDKIYNYFKPKEEIMKQHDTMNNGEPLAFSAEISGVMSDTYSFFDMSSEDLSAKGGGGFRQMHHFAKLNQNDKFR